MPLSVVVINAACNCDDVRVNEYEDLDMIFSAPCFLPLARSALAITSRFILFYFILQWAFCTTDRVDYRTYGTTSLPITTPLARTFTVRRNEKLIIATLKDRDKRSAFRGQFAYIHLQTNLLPLCYYASYHHGDWRARHVRRRAKTSRVAPTRAS
jgi:hypothetical protein